MPPPGWTLRVEQIVLTQDFIADNAEIGRLESHQQTPAASIAPISAPSVVSAGVTSTEQAQSVSNPSDRLSRFDVPTRISVSSR